MENKRMVYRVRAIGLLIVSLIFLVVFLTDRKLVLFSPLAFIPLLFAASSSRRVMGSILKLLLIIVIWLGLMIAANGIEKVKSNLIQGYEHIKGNNED
ncbi:hypothetical protein PUR_01730 [Paenibacillus sp. URB8-2]|nr:hypothetical protein PUR_01730 [Paenibacillus sp. URB8-2]